MNITVSPNIPPPCWATSPSHAYWERDTDPWHASQFPDHLKGAAPRQEGEPMKGWMSCDWAGNQVGFYPDGAVYATIREMQPTGQKCSSCNRDILGKFYFCSHEETKPYCSDCFRRTPCGQLEHEEGCDCEMSGPI